ncbi:hypothetical protein L6452_00899 [Arctium lappa]|uniref:Uncharacterized protein n=1 Tax=Arctium lappa TaxID=4217 RepID=A0ACB9FG06_ARCLA|nr:hypothetical protein L6452_00899 [Arctium lappa]
MVKIFVVRAFENLGLRHVMKVGEAGQRQGKEESPATSPTTSSRGPGRNVESVYTFSEDCIYYPIGDRPSNLIIYLEDPQMSVEEAYDGQGKLMSWKCIPNHSY